MESLRGEEAAGAASDLQVAARSRELAGDAHDSVLGTATTPTIVWHGPDERVVAAGTTATLTATGTDRFTDIRTDATALFEACDTAGVPYQARPRLYGGFAFHDGATGANTGTDAVWHGFEDAWFVLPEIQLTTTEGTTWLTATARGPEAGDRAARRLDEWVDRLEEVEGRDDTEGTTTPTGPPGIADQHQTPSRADWNEQVTAATEAIEDGQLRKVVLAQSLAVDLAGPLSMADTLARLDERYPDCYRFAFSPTDDAGTFFGATPERLVSLRGRTVQTEALAGSTGRGDTPAEDEWLTEELRDSEKDNHEHDLVVEAIRGQLSPLAASVTAGERTIRRLATVQHLQTPIRAELAADHHVLSLVEALHPTPAVGGLPPDVALETIKATEAFDRGWYAAPVGWIDGAGNGTFSVAIRSALATDQQAYLFAGAGIVADSDPDREWDEVQLKYRPMLDELE